MFTETGVSVVELRLLQSAKLYPVVESMLILNFMEMLSLFLTLYISIHRLYFLYKPSPHSLYPPLYTLDRKRTP